MKALLVTFFVLCGLLIPIELLITRRPHFGWERWTSFYAAFGFVGCALLVLVSKYVLRPLVKRDEDRYGD